jgi:hypothetical protein
MEEIGRVEMHQPEHVGTIVVQMIPVVRSQSLPRDVVCYVPIHPGMEHEAKAVAALLVTLLNGIAPDVPEGFGMPGAAKQWGVDFVVGDRIITPKPSND